MKKWVEFFERYGVLIAFVLLFVISAAIRPDVVLKPENLKNLVNQNVSVGIIAIGMTLVIITGGIDLSVGSMLALSSALSLLALRKAVGDHGSEAAASLIAFLVCVGSAAAMGAFNGLMVAYARIVPFIATLVGLVGFRSLCSGIAQGGEIRSASDTVFPALGNGGLPVPFLHIDGGGPLVITYGMLLFVGCAFAAGFVLNWTKLGRHLIATGANERAAVYSAVPTKRVKFIAYALMGVFTGLAAFAQVTRMNSVASGTMGQYYELDAIAAVVIGGTSLSGGKGRIWATVAGVLMLGLISNILTINSDKISVYYQGAVKGGIILAAVLLQRSRSE